VYRNKQRGFTLIEILVALTVFAITSSALITSMTRHVSQSSAIRDKTIAHWVAQNEMSQMRLSERYEENQSEPGRDVRFPDLGSVYKEVIMADQEWQVRITVSTTRNEDIRQIVVDVSRGADADEAALVSLDGFMGRY
jgi:general secretion pathway protein I